MSPQGAILVKGRFKNTPGYDEFVKHYPEFGAAVDALPNLDSLPKLNRLLLDIISDAIMTAEEFIARQEGSGESEASRERAEASRWMNRQRPEDNTVWLYPWRNT